MPQGTVLGSTLLLIYINDIANNITSNIRLLADDYVLYRTINSTITLQEGLNKLEHWQMDFNVKKCATMHFSSSNWKQKYELGDNCIQNFYLGRYIVGYAVGNLVLRRRASGAVKRDFRTYIRRYTSPNENFEYGYPHSDAFLQFRLKLERCKPYKNESHPTICDVINDVKLFPTVYRRIYCRKFLTLSNQMSRYKSKCIRIQNERRNSRNCLAISIPRD